MKHSEEFMLFVLAILFFACNTNESSANQTQNSGAQDTVVIETNNKLNKDQQIRASYFTATGTEPFWALEISEDVIKLTTLEDTIITRHTAPMRAMDVNMKRYKIKNESYALRFHIVQTECTNDMSGEVSAYAVDIECKRIRDQEITKIQGCGNYITDYRLHDIWVLEKLDGSDITKADFSKEFPMMEINSSTNTFMGFAGCNRMNGSFFYEKDLLRFTKIITTKMMCEPSNKESDFIKTLEKITAYTIGNNRLSLYAENGETLVFKKVD